MEMISLLSRKNHFGFEPAAYGLEVNNGTIEPLLLGNYILTKINMPLFDKTFTLASLDICDALC